ncbi:MAG: T9SS type A sorting domain-containing protein, partial [Tamlana sp.]
SALNFNMYPNPVKNGIVYFKTTQNLDIEIYNVLGKLITKENITQSKNSVNVTNLNKGIYLIKLIYKDGEVTKKLIKQ